MCTEGCPVWFAACCKTPLARGCTSGRVHVYVPLACQVRVTVGDSGLSSVNSLVC